MTVPPDVLRMLQERLETVRRITNALNSGKISWKQNYDKSSKSKVTLVNTIFEGQEIIITYSYNMSGNNYWTKCYCFSITFPNKSSRNFHFSTNWGNNTKRFYEGAGTDRSKECFDLLANAFNLVPT